MLGKTHVVASLAAAHAGLLYYLNQRKSAETGVEVPELFGVAIEPVPLLTYGLVMLTVLMFVLLLLRAGNLQLFMGYGVVGGMMLFLLYLFPDLAGGFEIAGVLLAFGFGALLPDIDSEESTLGRYVPFISKAIPHRTITHTIWAVLLIGGISWYAGSIYGVALTAGYALHILQDSFSKQGIAWFYPIGGYDKFGSGAVMKKGRRKPKFAYKTGGTGETVLFYSSIGVHVVCVTLVVWLGIGVI